MSSERCGNCRFLEPTASVCRRYPPTIAVIDGKEVSFHLVVFTDIGWCGEWQAIRDPRTGRVVVDKALDDPDVSQSKAPADWPAEKTAEFLNWRGPVEHRGFQELRRDIRDFIQERYPSDHSWALRPVETR